jgi:alanyl-tRNA synthetase
MFLSTHDIRSAFLTYFEKKGHHICPSASLIPHNDPSLLFTNSGMVPMKDVFTGRESRSYNKASSCQKCLRAGGKHNDLDQVGKTDRHHTFFEMVGNFSFGDYFKEQAIAYAWDMIVHVLGIDSERLYVTIHSSDQETFDLWQRIAGLPAQRLISIATDDNFWSMGPTGPCGPCTEIFYDHGDHLPGGLPGSAEQDGPRFVEIWNLVFMQYEQQEDGSRVLLPKPCVDTGAGLERLAAVLQGTHDNYRTDILKTIIHASAVLSDQRYTTVSADDLPNHLEAPLYTAHRVIADHLRSAAFLIADGVLPSNDGRGYVLRRIIRRALRYVHLLRTSYGVKNNKAQTSWTNQDPFFYQLVPVLCQTMGEHYGELWRAKELIEKTLKREEERFSELLTRGLGLLNEALKTLNPQEPLAGEIIFQLYDTFGFPRDLTESLLEERQLQGQWDVFEQLMEEQRHLARQNWKGSGEKKISDKLMVLAQEWGPTIFTGYENIQDSGKIQGLWTAEEENTPKESQQPLSTIEVVLSQTPFYAESGGQIGDQGKMFGFSNQTHLENSLKVAWSHVAQSLETLKNPKDLGDSFDISPTLESFSQEVADLDSNNLEIFINTLRQESLWAGDVKDVQKKQDLFFHNVLLRDQNQKNGLIHGPLALENTLKDTIQVGQWVWSCVDIDHRRLISGHHSATHLLHSALRKVLGAHVTQKGSLVNTEKLRFDFSHFQPLSPEELLKIENTVNNWILENHPVYSRLMSKDQAIAYGALALFGEKYDKDVRVIWMGQDHHSKACSTQYFDKQSLAKPHDDQQPGNSHVKDWIEKDPTFDTFEKQGKSLPVSVELCGGTHVRRTGDIGLFKILSQSGLGSGVRRIEACAGMKVLEKLRDLDATVRAASDLCKTSPQGLLDRLAKMLCQHHQEVLDKHKPKDFSLHPTEYSFYDMSVWIAETQDLDAKKSTTLLDALKNRIGSGVVIVKNNHHQEAKVSVLVGITKNLVEQGIDGRLWIKALSFLWKGSGGGGRADFAQSGGQNFAIKDLVKQLETQRDLFLVSPLR